jgi:hypothetical protein
VDVSPFSDFTYEDKTSWYDFLLINDRAHNAYNDVLEGIGIGSTNYPLLEVDDTPDGRRDWLALHYLMHLNLASLLGLTNVPDLQDVDLQSDEQFYNWLQLHMQQHQLIDAALNL